MAEFRMPSLGADMDEGTLVEWLVSVGDHVRRGDVVAVVDTAKSAIEVEVFEDGMVEELLVEPGVTVAVGTPLARLASADDVDERDVDLAPPPTGDRHAVSPYARRRAQELAIDPDALVGSGPSGAVTVADVERAASAQTASAPAASAPAASAQTVPRARAREQQSAMRRTIGDLMARSKREIPHYYLSTTIDLARATDWLRKTNADRGVEERIVPAAVLLKAVASAIRVVPEVNGFFRDGDFERSDEVHLGVAVSLRGGGLIAPALHNADAQSVTELMDSLKDLVARARSGRLRGSEMSDPTITVTNLGDQGVESVVGVIYPPQVALVGFGRVVERPWVIDGEVAIRPVVTATLAADHRVTDGHRGGLFLAAVDELLQRPEEL